jgi:hypothetical protein
MIDEDDDECGGGTARGAAAKRGVVVVVVAVAAVVAVVCTGVAEDAPAIAVAVVIGAVTSVSLAVSKTSVSPSRRVDASVELGRDISDCCSRYVECASVRIRTGGACIREEERWNREFNDSAERDGDALEGARQVVARSPPRRIRLD